MRNIFLFLSLLLSLFVLIPCSTSVAYADDLGDSVNETLDGIDTSALEELLSSLQSSENVGLMGTVRSMVEDVLQGKNVLDYSYFLNFATSVLLGEVQKILPFLLTILILCVLYGVLHNMTFGWKRVNVNKIVYFVCFGLIVAIIAHLVSCAVSESLTLFSRLENLSEKGFPVLVTMIAAVGGNASATVYQPMVLTFGEVLLKLVKFVVLPMFYATFVFGVVGNLSENFRLDALSKTIKSGANWILGLSFGLFSALLGAEGITGATVDGLAARGAKFALSNYVPIVGSYLTEGFDVVVAGCLAVKNALGFCSILLLILSVLIPIIRILIVSFSLRLAGGILQPVTDEKLTKILVSSGESMKILLTAIICSFFAALLFLMSAVFLCNVGVL